MRVLLALLAAFVPATAMAHTLRGLAFAVIGIPAFVASSLLVLVIAYRMCEAVRRWRVLPWVVCALPLLGVLHFQLSAFLLDTRALQPALAPLGVNDELVCASLVPLLLPALTWLAFRLARRRARLSADAAP